MVKLRRAGHNIICTRSCPPAYGASIYRLLDGRYEPGRYTPLTVSVALARKRLGEPHLPLPWLEDPAADSAAHDVTGQDLVRVDPPAPPRADTEDDEQ